MNDHGLLNRDERAANMKSMRTMGRIMSRYLIDPLDPAAGYVIVETSAQWDETTTRLENET